MTFANKYFPIYNKQWASWKIVIFINKKIKKNYNHKFFWNKKYFK